MPSLRWQSWKACLVRSCSLAFSPAQIPTGFDLHQSNKHIISQVWYCFLFNSEDKSREITQWRNTLGKSLCCDFSPQKTFYSSTIVSGRRYKELSVESCCCSLSVQHRCVSFTILSLCLPTILYDFYVHSTQIHSHKYYCWCSCLLFYCLLLIVWINFYIFVYDIQSCICCHITQM